MLNETFSVIFKHRGIALLNLCSFHEQLLFRFSFYYFWLVIDTSLDNFAGGNSALRVGKMQIIYQTDY